MKRAFVCLVAVLSALSCGPTRDSSSYGLRKVELRLSDEDYPDLLNGGAAKTPVIADLRFDDGDRLGGTVSLAGEGSLTGPKKGYRFEIRGDLGPAPARSLRLSPQAQDSSFLRTLLGARILAEAGLPVSSVEPVSLYLNGAFLGLYMMIERIDENYFESRGERALRVYRSKVNRSDFGERMISDPESGMELELGNYHRQDIQRLARWAAAPVSSGSLGELEATAVADSMIRYFAASVFMNNCDGINNNIYLFNTRASELFRFAPWDWERAYDGTCDLDLMIQKNHLLKKIFQYPALRASMIERIGELQARFTPDVVRSVLDSGLSRIESAYRADRELGGTGHLPSQEARKLFEIYSSWNLSLMDELRARPSAP